jgi:hypothetical protein
MKSHPSLAGLFAATALLLAGCNYDEALTAKPTRPVDERLVGIWLGGENGREQMVVRQLDYYSYVVSMDDDLYRAYHSEFAGTAFFSVQDLNSDYRLYLYLTAELSADGHQLTLRTVSNKVVPESTKGRAALQELIQANLANPGLFGDPIVFKRKQSGGSD